MVGRLVEEVVTGTVVVGGGVVVVVVVPVVVVLGAAVVGLGVVVLFVVVEVVVLGVTVVGLGVVVVVVVLVVVVGTALVLDNKVTSTLGYSGTGTSMFKYAGNVLVGFQTVIRYPYLGATLGTTFTLGTSLFTTNPAYLRVVALVTGLGVTVAVMLPLVEVTGLGVTVMLLLVEVTTFFLVQPTCLRMSALVGVFFLVNLDFPLFGLLGFIISDGKYLDGVLEVVGLVAGGASVRDSCTVAIASRTTSRLHENVIISYFYVYNTIQYF